MSWETVVNKGVGEWDIVTASKPGAAVTTSWCNAVPDVEDWNTVSAGKQHTWTHVLQRKLPQIPGKIDAEGHTIDIEWRINWEYASQYRGKGMFIRSVWVELLKCDVVPHFDVRVEFRGGQPRNDNPNPGWPMAVLQLGSRATITTPKWQRVIEQNLYELNYNGHLIVR